MDPVDSILVDPLLLPDPDPEAASKQRRRKEDETVAGVTDYRGRPVCRGSSGGWRSALFVVAVEIAGSFAYFGISANLITYLTGPLGQSNASAAASVNAWSGTASLMPLLGAFLADAYLGRYRSIIIACSLYVLGYGMLTLSATVPALRPSHLPCRDDGGSRSSSCEPEPGWAQVAFFYASLYLIAFAADQFDPKERASRGSLFNWWFFCMAMGISVAVAVVGYIQETVGWGVGFGVPCAIVLAASTVFLLGTPTYRLPAHSDDRQPPLLLVRRPEKEDQDDRQSPLVRLARGLRRRPSSSSPEEKEDARCVLRLLPIWASSLAYVRADHDALQQAGPHPGPPHRSRPPGGVAASRRAAGSGPRQHPPLRPRLRPRPGAGAPLGHGQPVGAHHAAARRRRHGHVPGGHLRGRAGGGAAPGWCRSTP